MKTAKKKGIRKEKRRGMNWQNSPIGLIPDMTWLQLIYYAKLLSLEIFCLLPKTGAGQYIFLFNILTKRTKTSRNLTYKASTRLSFVRDGTLLLSNYGYAVSFVNLLLLEKKGWVPIGVIKAWSRLWELWEDWHVSFSIACTISVTRAFLKRVLRGQCYVFLLLRRQRVF